MSETGDLRPFAGRVAIVTGGSQGLGRAVAERLVDSGASGLLLVGRDQVKGERTAAEVGTAASAGSCDVRFLSTDLAEPDAADRVVAACDEAFGTCHALVNAAALTVRDSVWDATAASWDAMLATNVRSPGLLTSAVARLMVDRGVEGSIVHVGSVTAHGGAPELFSYSTSKSALVAMVRNAAFALARHRVRVNLVQPGWMNTPAEDEIQRRFHGAQDGWLEAAAAKQAFGRLIDPNELARMIAFLASDESGLMTGSVIDFDQAVLGVEMQRSDLQPVWGEQP